MARACWNSIESTVPIEKVIGKGTTASVNLEANKQCSYRNPPCPSMFQGRSESVAPSRESSSAILSRGWTAISNINTINSSYSVDSRPEPWFLINETVLSASGGGALSETRPTSHPTSKNTSGNFHQVAGKCCERQVESSHR